ncbi:hypothetical protein LQ948_10500 [Jiella sp. MQZ9-1]|uniref:Uncharacterized protein n=1 Tax=Jiella flava TaxID=2816857 RepID=A0A939FZT9_9HYPH|nr:hypothetical protein [Jiella flava]MBO0662414.1 hypothetical protein [Jiella flava]MCD2471638.1 hypothetical protein [Jiella flava]
MHNDNSLQVLALDAAKSARDRASTPEAAPSTLDAVMTMLYEVPLVLALRIPKLMSETGTFSPLERTETRQAIVEKSGAAFEGAVAAQVAAIAALLTLQAETMSGRLMPWHVFGAVDAVVAAGLAPSVERLRANDDRLSRER